MSKLEIRLLGAPELQIDGSRIGKFVTRKAHALLIYLICHNRPYSRDLLAGMLWPDYAEADAKNSLRRALSGLRTRIGAYLDSDRQTICFVRHAPFWLDIEEFAAAMRLVRVGATLAEPDFQVLERSLGLYTAEFLAGFTLADAPAFEEWVLLQREHLREQALRGLSFLTEHFVQTRQIHRGLASSQRLLALEPWHETGYQQRMVLLAWNGERSAALQQYEACRQMLADEFGLLPADETLSLYKRIKAGEFDPFVPPIQVGSQPETIPAHLAATPTGPTLGLEDVPRQPVFVGREAELAQLQRWHGDERYAVVAILGVGGAGKTALTAHYVRSSVAQQIGNPRVDRVLWASLLNAPPLSSLLRIWLRALTDQKPSQLPMGVPEGVDEQLALLFPLLRVQRCLLVLDNLESILDQGDARGQFRTEYKDYALFLQRMAELPHASCLLLTTRELPAVLARRKVDHSGTVRVLSLGGLPVTTGVDLLARAGLADASSAAMSSEVEALVTHYSGNPLALKLVADTVRDLYGGDLRAFLAQGIPVFGDIRTVLDEQTARLTDLEREILAWLAVEREPVPVASLWESLVGPLDRHAILQAMNTLLHTSLVEREMDPARDAPVQLTLQNVVMEHVTDHLLRSFYEQMQTGEGQAFRRHPLVKADSPEYVQASQRRLLLQPVADWAVKRWGRTGAIQHLQQMLARAHTGGQAATGYAAANILHLLLASDTNLRGLDFSGTAVRQADLRTAALVDFDFELADLSGSVFAGTFGAIASLAVSPDGRFIAAGSSDGDIYLWHSHGYRWQSVLKRHGQAVSSLQFSADGRLLASGGLDGLTCLWEVPTATLARAIETPGRSVIAVAFHPDGACLAAADTDGMIRIWQWQPDELAAAMRAASIITGLSFSPDGHTLVSVGDERTIHIWDAGAGELLHTLNGHAGKISAVAFHPAGAQFATGGEDGEICLWDSQAAKLDRTLAGHRDFVLSLAFDRAGASLASCSADQTACVWDLAAGTIRRVLAGHRGWVTAVAFSADGRALATGGYDQTVRIWEAQSGRLQHTLSGRRRWVDSVGFSPDGRLVAACSLDGPVQIWEVATGKLLHDLRGSQAATRAVAFSRTGDLLATASDDHQVRIWDVRRGELMHTLRGHTGLVREVAFSPDGRTVISGSHDRTLRIWEVATGQGRRTIPDVNAPIRNAIAFNPAGNLLAYGVGKNSIVLEEPLSGEIVRTIPTGNTTPQVVGIDPSGRFLACGTKEGTVWIYDLADAAHEAAHLRIHVADKPVWRLLFSPDGASLAWVCAGQEVRLLCLANEQVSAALPSHYGAFCLGFSTDGKFLITDGPDHTLLQRDTATGAVCRSLHGHAAGVTSIDVSPADNRIASSSADGTVRVWSMQTGECLAVLTAPGPYAGMRIAGATGLTPAQREALVTLGAIDEEFSGFYSTPKTR